MLRLGFDNNLDSDLQRSEESGYWLAKTPGWVSWWRYPALLGTWNPTKYQGREGRKGGRIVTNLGRVDDDIDSTGEGEEEVTELDDDLAPQRLCSHLPIAQHVVRLVQVDEGLGGVTHHQHHHHPCQQGHHSPVPPAQRCKKGGLTRLVI